MGNPWGNERVPFDFEGSLELAKSMWSLANEVEGAAAKRSAAANVAKAKWRGAYGTEFEGRMGDEGSGAKTVAAGLRAEAKGWAKAWKKAMDEQNRRNRADRVAEIRNSRSWFERNVGDRIKGDDSEQQVKALKVATVPCPPDFAATMTEQRF